MPHEAGPDVYASILAASAKAENLFIGRILF